MFVHRNMPLISCLKDSPVAAAGAFDMNSPATAATGEQIPHFRMHGVLGDYAADDCDNENHRGNQSLCEFPLEQVSLILAVEAISNPARDQREATQACR